MRGGVPALRIAFGLGFSGDSVGSSTCGLPVLWRNRHKPTEGSDPTFRGMTKARRPYLYVINALRQKYGKLKGLLIATPSSNQMIDDLAHVGAVLLMFDPETDLAAVPVIRPYKAKRERWSRTVLQVLRKADRPLRATELARMVMALHGVDPDDHERLFSISCSLQAVLGRLADQGIVTITGSPRRWAVARD